MDLILMWAAIALAVVIVALLVIANRASRPTLIAHRARRSDDVKWELEVIDHGMTWEEAQAARARFAEVVGLDPDQIAVRWRE